MADGAIFHVDVSTVSRSQGRSAVAAAAYRAAELLVDARTGLEHDFRRKQGVVESYIAAPDDCEWIEHRQALWDAAEAAENRKNSTVAREWLMVNDALEAADSEARVDHRRKSVIVAEMRAAAKALNKQAANIDALKISGDFRNTSGLMKTVGKAARAIKEGGITAITSKASDAPKLREQARDLELMAAELADTEVGKHDGPQLTAYKRRMVKA